MDETIEVPEVEIGGAMNTTVLIATEDWVPKSVKVGINGVIIIGCTSDEVVKMYNAYQKGEAAKYRI